MRHAAASLLIADGLPIAVSAMLGHALTSTTLNTYAHVLPGADRPRRKRWSGCWDKRSEQTVGGWEETPAKSWDRDPAPGSYPHRRPKMIGRL